MIRQLLRYGAGLIGLFIVVSNGSKFGQVIQAGARGTSEVTRTLQGR